MKDDMGDQALTDEEGYEFKRLQVAAELDAEDMSGVAVLFFNVESDDAAKVSRAVGSTGADARASVPGAGCSTLCDAATEIGREPTGKHAVTAAIGAGRPAAEYVSSGVMESAGARERHAYEEALSTVRGNRYALSLAGLASAWPNIVHQVGVGAARDARLRSRDWFAKIRGHVERTEGGWRT
ncbi:MAG: hypothetical protein R3C69_04355 [Geminicoccaceae bacterium]